MNKILRRGIKPLLILFCAFLFVSTIASANTIVQIVLPTTTVNQGEVFTVYVQIIPDRPLKGAQVDLTYNSSLLTGDASDGGMFLNFIPPNVNPGEFSQMSEYQMPSEDAVDTTGNLAEIQFTASATETGQTDLNLLNVKVKDENGIGLPASEVDVIVGSVTVKEINDCQDFCLELEEGLNFVSIPKTIDATDISGRTIFDIDQFSGEQVQYFNPHDGWDSNPDVIPCRGFQVLKDTSMTVCVNFVTDSQPQQELYKGWNMIGHVHTEDMVVFEVNNPFDFASKTGLEYPEGNLLFMQLNTYSQTTGWSYYPDDFSDMTPGLGYYILMKQDTTMYGMQ